MSELFLRNEIEDEEKMVEELANVEEIVASTKIVFPNILLRDKEIKKALCLQRLRYLMQQQSV